MTAQTLSTTPGTALTKLDMHWKRALAEINNVARLDFFISIAYNTDDEWWCE